MKTVAVQNLKGGIGKTTTAIELAEALSKLGNRVVVIDYDPSTNLTTFVNGTINCGTVYDALISPEPEMCIQKLDNLDFDLIAGDAKLSTADKVFLEADDNYRLLDLCEAIAEGYDYCILDLGPSKTTAFVQAMVATDYVVAPLRGDDEGSVLAVSSLDSAISKLRSSRAQLSKAKIIACVVCGSDKRRDMDSAVREACKNYAEKNNLIMSVIPFGTIMGKMRGERTSIVKAKSGHEISREYFKLAEKIEELVEAE